MMNMMKGKRRTNLENESQLDKIGENVDIGFLFPERSNEAVALIERAESQIIELYEPC
jgi:hypothetical protein